MAVKLTHLLNTSKLHLNHFVCQAVLSSRSNVGHVAPGAGRQHDLVLDQGVLLHCGIDVATCQSVPSLHVSIQARSRAWTVLLCQVSEDHTGVVRLEDARCK